MTNTHFRCIVAAALLAGLGSGGCKARPSLTPHSDPALRKTNAQFAADAKKRHPYPADAPRGGEAVSRAQVGYDRDVIDVANLSGEDWKDLDVWVNKRYVVHVPRIERGRLRTLNFKMFYDEKGRSLPTSGTTINSIEVLRDGTMYDVPVRLAE